MKSIKIINHYGDVYYHNENDQYHKEDGPAIEYFDGEKYWYYKHCEAFLFPSYAEGFGLPVIEAMYHGKPAFISDKTSLPEVGGDAAYYFRSFDPDSMQQVFKKGIEDYLLADPSEKIKQQAAKFNWDVCASEYIEVYEEMI